MAEERRAPLHAGKPDDPGRTRNQGGQKAPAFTWSARGCARYARQFKGKVKIITTIPSVDTPVCDAETRRFNEEASIPPGDVVI